ncbi:MAG: hypothetical protein HZA92_12590 [Verrucomicrobia bacterium]|nr:hypothetical protein [Verrucomicrobiota bacterium]
MKKLLPSLIAAALGVSLVTTSAQDKQRPPQGRDGGQPGQPGRQGGGPGGPGGEGGFRPPKPPIEAALDVNGDGIIDAKELAAAAAALKRLDKNGDGQLTEDEYRPARPQAGPGGQGGQGGFGGQRGSPGQGGGPGEKGGEPRRPEGQPGGGGGPGDKPGADSDFITRLFQNDKNKDGKLTKDELPEAMQGIFERADVNRDGAIDRKEAEALAARMKQRGGSPGNDGKRPPLEK